MNFIIVFLGLSICLKAISLEHCINHILHQSNNEDFKCENNQEIHFYSTYVLPDGAYRCLDSMKGKQGFFVSTVKSFKQLQIKQSDVNRGSITLQSYQYQGWSCEKDSGLVRRSKFKGIKLFLSKCKHNKAQFEDICIIRGWPLSEMSGEDIL